MDQDQEPKVTQGDRDQMAKVYPQEREWTDAEIEMAKALGHL
jgi:lipopolysaccharide biosynthesis regulator YciM